MTECEGPVRRPRSEGREIDDCPAVRHRHSMRGYHDDGCRCPSTLAAREEKLARDRAKYKTPEGATPRPRASEERESDDCPATRHRKSLRGYYKDGCRCPTTMANHEARLEWQRRYHKVGAHVVGPQAPKPPDYGREVDDCPATRHRHSGLGYRKDGCRCPSTLKAYDRLLEMSRASERRYRQRLKVRESRKGTRFDLRLADRLDAEAIALGFRTGKVDKHTRGLAVKMMLDRDPRMTDRQIMWRLRHAGQGTTVSGNDLDIRTVTRIVAGVNFTRKRAGLEPYPRMGMHGDGLPGAALTRRTTTPKRKVRA
jgi:hypothetical protein